MLPPEFFMSSIFEEPRFSELSLPKEPSFDLLLPNRQYPCFLIRSRNGHGRPFPSSVGLLTRQKWEICG